MKILTAQETRDAECKCFDLYSSEAELMLRAGTACFEKIIKIYGKQLKNSAVSVLCGNGKNAGDGFVIAKLLYSFGADAKIVICDKMPSISDPLMYFEHAVKSGVKHENFTQKSTDCDFIIDCMFGIGFSGEPRAPFDSIFSSVNKSSAVVISVDTPSGSNSTTGEVCADCVRADLTVAISTLKYAHILPPSNDFCGRVECVDIGIPDDCYTVCGAQTVENDFVQSVFSRREKNSNKGTFGRQLNICGSYRMPGAAVFAAQGALRSGTGLLVAALPDKAYPLVECHTCQPVFVPCETSEEGTFSAKAPEQLADELAAADSVVIGCGLGCNNDTAALVEFVLKNAKCPVILDADGINCINRRIDIIKDIKAPVVLTPHPGEMGRLISKSPAEVQRSRIECAKEFALHSGAIVVLKGASTVITDGERVLVNTTGNPGMAMGGTGDMLSGMIGSFAAQGMSPFDAAAAGVYIHGLCGDCVKNELSMRGITVFDMLDRLGVLMSLFEYRG